MDSSQHLKRVILHSHSSDDAGTRVVEVVSITWIVIVVVFVVMFIEVEIQLEVLVVVKGVVVGVGVAGRLEDGVYDAPGGFFRWRPMRQYCAQEGTGERAWEAYRVS